MKKLLLSGLLFVIATSAWAQSCPPPFFSYTSDNTAKTNSVKMAQMPDGTTITSTAINLDNGTPIICTAAGCNPSVSWSWNTGSHTVAGTVNWISGMSETVSVTWTN